MTVSDDAILAAIPDLARATGVFAEPAAAASWAALKQLAASGALDPGETIVGLVSGHGLKDIARARQAAGDPITIDPDPDAVLAALGGLGLAG